MDRVSYIRKEINKGGLILDVGCSSGFLHDQITGNKIIGVDIKPARNKKNFVIGDAQRLPIKGASFRVIVAGEMLEHLESPELFLLECKRVLIKGGKLIISTPNKYSLINRVFSSYRHKSHISLFGIKVFRELVSRYFLEEDFFLLPYDRISSYNSKHKKLFWLRKIMHYLLPRSLQENMIIKCSNDK